MIKKKRKKSSNLKSWFVQVARRSLLALELPSAINMEPTTSTLSASSAAHSLCGSALARLISASHVINGLLATLLFLAKG